MTEDALRITVLGSGTSSGVPTIGCKCAVCLSTDPHDNRLRPSVLLQYGGRNVLIDTTPDFRAQVLRAHIDRIDAILLHALACRSHPGARRSASFQFPSGRADSDLRHRENLRRRSAACFNTRSIRGPRNPPRRGWICERIDAEPFELFGRRVHPHSDCRTATRRCSDFAWATRLISPITTIFRKKRRPSCRIWTCCFWTRCGIARIPRTRPSSAR